MALTKATYSMILGAPVNVLDYGADPTGVADSTAAFAAAFAAADAIVIPGENDQTYRLSLYRPTAGKTVIGIGNPTLNLFEDSTPVMVQFLSDTRHENIKFNSTETDLYLQRATIENVSNVYIKNCGFFGFRHVNPAPDAWGLYISNSENITVDNCKFGNNSQSDIVVVDVVRNLTIINPSNDVDANGVYLNVEPNANDGVRYMTVTGGKYRKISLLENSFTSYASQNIAFSGIECFELMYDGSGVEFDDACAFNTLVPEDPTGAISYAGNLNVSLGLSRNLVDDPYLLSCAYGSASSEWTNNTVPAVAWDVVRFNNIHGDYFATNVNNVFQVNDIKSKKLGILDVAANNNLLFMQYGWSGIPLAAGFIGNRTVLNFYDVGNNLIGFTRVAAFRGLAGTRTQTQADFAVINPPAGTASVEIVVSSPLGASTVSDQFIAVGLWEIIDTLVNTTNTRALVSQFGQQKPIVSRGNVDPSSVTSAGGFVGDTVEKLTPVVGQSKGWVCTVAGKPGTWASLGNL